MNIKSCEACELTLNIEISRRKLGSHKFSPRLQLQLLVVGKTSGTSLPLGEQRAPDYKGYRLPSRASCRLPLHPFPSRRRRESTRRLPPKSPASHHLRNPPNPPSNPPKRTTSALPWSSLSPLRWSGDPYGRGLISSSGGK